MTMKALGHTWRSLLYVPGNNERFLSKAQDRGADALVLDLEDSVPLDRKSDARNMVKDRIASLATGPADLIVRINGGLRDVVADLDAVVKPGLVGVMIAKCETPEKPAMVAEILSDIEEERGLPQNSIALLALIETPGGLENAYAIARSSSRLTAMLLGSEDFATACQMTPSPETLTLAKQQLVYAARSAGVAPLGLLDTVANFSGDQLGDMIRRSKSFGFSGSTCVHPSMVGPLNNGFLPSKEEVSGARRIIAAMEAANEQGLGAVRLDGRMIDAPVLRRAQSTLARTADKH